MGTSRVDGGSYARLGPERGSMLTGPGLSAPACGCLFGECVGFPLSSAPLLLRFHLFLTRDAAPRPCHRGDVPDALAG